MKSVWKFALGLGTVVTGTAAAIWTGMNFSSQEIPQNQTASNWVKKGLKSNSKHTVEQVMKYSEGLFDGIKGNGSS